MKIPVIENVLKLNDEIAAINRQALKDAGVYTIDLIGAPGCGKTALLEATLKHLRNDLEIGVLVGDLTTSRDAQRIARWTQHVVQINTGHGCHLDANQVRQGLQQLDLPALDVLVIENVGNLICPVGFDLGQDDKVGMFSVSEGDDKAAKHPYLVHESSVVVLNKLDLLPHVTFDRNLFRNDVQRSKPSVEVMEISVATGQVSAWLDWLLGRSRRS
jgi:hydrogenase nickel incorporation protein HypB